MPEELIALIATQPLEYSREAGFGDAPMGIFSGATDHNGAEQCESSIR